MRILFVHQNFPAQFVHLAPALHGRGHDVRALTVASNAQPSTVPRLTYAYEPPKPAPQGLTAGFDAHAHRGAVVARAAEAMKMGGHNPDLIFGHVGWGESMYLKQVWPSARLIAYAEFYWRAHGLYYDFDPAIYPRQFEPTLQAATTTAAMLVTLAQADRILSPTRWQARSFPAAFQPRITTIHDGIDTAAAAPSAAARVGIGKRGLTFQPGAELLTFINRTLEPHRGYHVFMRALPEVLKARPEAHVIIVGGSEGGYGAAPGGGRTWRQIFLDEVAHRLDLSRVHFVGKVPHKVFLDLMRVTRVHAYLTYPGVLSWSMLEAMSCGAALVASRTAPVEEVVQDGVNGRLVDFFDVPAWSAALIEMLAQPERHDELRAQARRTIVESYDLTTVCLPALIRLVEDAVAP